MISVSRKAFAALPKDLTWDALVQRVDDREIQWRKDLERFSKISGEDERALMYRGEHGIVKDLACLHTQGW